MYEIVLSAHSWLRWGVVLLGFLTVLRAIGGWQQRNAWTRRDERMGLLFMIALDLQVVLGLLLYFVYSPYTALAMDDFGAAMRSPDLRFWAVEHVFGMLVAIALAHIGRARIKKTVDERRRHRVGAIFFGLALLAILAAIPWPGMPNARPLLRW